MGLVERAAIDALLSPADANAEGTAVPAATSLNELLDAAWGTAGVGLYRGFLESMTSTFTTLNYRGFASTHTSIRTHVQQGSPRRPSWPAIRARRCSNYGPPSTISICAVNLRALASPRQSAGCRPTAPCQN
jgi:hypothetical protein